MARVKHVFSCVLSATLFLGVGFPKAQAQESVAFTTVSLGPQSGIHAPTALVVRTTSEWQALWRRHASGAPQARTVPPVVDFSRDMVVAAFAGEVTNGSRFGILKVIPEANRLVVLVRLMGPPGPERGDETPVTPFHIIRLPRSLLPVVFRTKIQDLD